MLYLELFPVLFLTQRTSFLWLLMGVEGLALGEKTRKEATGIVME